MSHREHEDFTSQTDLYFLRASLTEHDWDGKKHALLYEADTNVRSVVVFRRGVCMLHQWRSLADEILRNVEETMANTRVRKNTPKNALACISSV